MDKPCYFSELTSCLKDSDYDNMCCCFIGSWWSNEVKYVKPLKWCIDIRCHFMIWPGRKRKWPLDIIHLLIYWLVSVFLIKRFLRFELWKMTVKWRNPILPKNLNSLESEKWESSSYSKTICDIKISSILLCFVQITWFSQLY